jgi:hypothetical protein
MATPIQQEDLSFELGDRILILGGRHDGLRGRIYYIDDESLIRVLPDGVSDRLVELPIIDNDFDPDLEITEAFSISKRTNPAFVAQIDAHVGSRAYTFGLNGEPGPVYIVKSVSEKDDTLLLTDETGAELLLECNFKGIPLDEAFAVIRVRAPEDVSINVDGDVVGEDAPPEEEGDDFMDVVEDALESELQFEIQEIPKAQRFYPDLVQRNDMLQDLVASLNAVQQKSPEEHKAIRIFVEQCILLRNSLVIYSKSGEPIGIRQTSYSTLSELLEDAGNIPLSRYILNASKTLYLDRDREEIRNEVIEPHSENGLAVNLKFLDVTINNTVDYMNTQLGGIQSASENVNSLPNWFISWETLNMQFHSNWTSHGDVDTVQFKADKEFFRGIPDIESAGIDGLPRLEADKDTLVNSDLVSKVSIGMMRGLGPRATRLKQKDDAQRRVESAEMGELTGTLVFPLSEKRDLGAIRSGSIAQDIAMSQMESQTMHTILERLEGIPDTVTAGGILSVGMDGNTQGNIPLEDWLRVLPIHPLGMGDIPLSLANYGLVQKEFTLDQQDVFVEKFQMMRALIKQYIIEIREAANKAASEHTITANPFLSETAFEEMRAVLEKEPLLAEGMETLGKLTPTYKGSDVATISYLLLTAQDLFIKGLAQIPGPLAVERSRRVRQQFLDALNNALAKALKRKNSGEEPVPNTCPHVASINAIYRVKDVALRMPLFAKFLTKFQGGRKDNWVECAFGCGRPICCYHEVLLLQEYLHPREKDALHKELLLKFSGGQFNGRYMCKNCGQSISELEFDTNLEFSDDGIPMMGRAVMAALDDEVDTALTGTDVEQLRFKTEAQNLIYAAARKLFDMLGINAVSESYTMIVQRVEADVLKQPSRKEYPKMIDGKRTLDYDIHINRIIVGSVAVNCLLEIQTNIPGYVMRYRIPGCRAGFSGYPLGNEKERTGMEYVACAVAAIQDPIAPWNLTGFQREAEKKRQDSVLALMDKRMTALLTNSSAQQQISVKRSHLKELFGSVVYSEQLPEQIPERFAPTPYNISDEETAKSAIVSQAASPSQVIRAWVLQAHRYAKDNGSYKKESVIAEATCCSSPIQTPNEFWKEKKDSMTTLPAKLPPRGPINSHLGLPFSPRRQENLEGKISPEIMYKIFLNVCYQGERIGLPHVPGYTNECTYCGFVYAESPYALNPVPPMSSDSKVQRDMMKSYNEEIAAIITKGKVSLETNKVKVNQGTFENILDLSHKAFRVEPIVAKRPLAGMKLFERLRTLTPEPFVGWKAAISVTLERLGALQENDDILEAYGTISNISSDIIEELKARLGEVNATALKRVLEGNPVQCIEIVRTHFLVPFQRLVTGFHTKSLRIPKSYKLGEGTEEDMNRILDSHLEYMATLAKRSTGFTLHKMKWAHARLVDALGLLKSSIRASYIPGGEAGLPFIVTALIGGILVEFINPNVVPPDMDEAAAGSVDTGARAPIQILDVCVQKLRLEGMNFTEEQIKDMIARRDNIEKASFIKRFDDLTPEAKAVEKMKKKLGLGDWAVGGTNVIYAYNPEQYEREREQRVTMGFEDFSQGQVVLEEGAEGAEGGYDNQQMGEDDY